MPCCAFSVLVWSPFRSKLACHSRAAMTAFSHVSARLWGDRRAEVVYMYSRVVADADKADNPLGDAAQDDREWAAWPSCARMRGWTQWKCPSRGTSWMPGRTPASSFLISSECFRRPNECLDRTCMHEHSERLSAGHSSMQMAAVWGVGLP